MAKHGNYSQEYINKLRDLYITSDYSFDYISKNSEELFGQFISVEYIKQLSANDDIPWSVLRSKSEKTSDQVSLNEKIAIIAEILYQSMIDEKKPLPPVQLAQVAKTWMELIDKSKMNKETTAKTTSQRVKDIFGELEALNKERSSSN